MWAPATRPTARACSKCPEQRRSTGILDGQIASLPFRWTAAGTEAFSPNLMTVVAYLRAAPGFPLSADDQRAAVVGLALREGLTLGRIYADGPGRGTTGRAALLSTVEGGRVSAVVTASICRLGKTWPGLLRFLGAIADARVSLLIADEDGQQEVEALLAAVPTLIDVRSTLHREAAAAGRERARSKGVRFGRPRIAEAKIVRVREALEAGAGVREAARRAGVSPASVVRMSQRGLNEPTPAMG